MGLIQKVVCMTTLLVMFAPIAAAHRLNPAHELSTASSELIPDNPLGLAAKDNEEKSLLPDSIDNASDPQQKGLLRIYRSNLLKKTYKHIVYPDSAIDKNQEGDVILRVTVDRSGKVKNIKYDLRARYNSLNKAAKSAIESAQPFPEVPSRIEGDVFELLMPIRFRLTG